MVVLVILLLFIITAFCYYYIKHRSKQYCHINNIKMKNTTMNWYQKSYCYSLDCIVVSQWLHYCTTSWNKPLTQVLHRCKFCLQHVRDLRWWDFWQWSQLEITPFIVQPFRKNNQNHNNLINLIINLTLIIPSWMKNCSIIFWFMTFIQSLIWCKVFTYYFW